MTASFLPLALFLAAAATAAQDYPLPADGGGQSPLGLSTLVSRPPAQVAKQLGEKQPESQKAKKTKKQADKSAEQGPPQVWLGLALRERLDGQRRLEVDEVFPDSPAASVDIRVGDKLVAVDGRPTARHTDVLEALRAHKIGDRVSVTVERSVAVTLGGSQDGGGQPFLGVYPLSSDDRRPDWKQGVAIDSTIEGSGAKAAGLRAGERICAVDGVEVKGFEGLRKAVQAKQPGAQVELRIQADLEPSLAARRSQESERAPASSGGAPPPVAVPPPPQPPQAGRRGWSWNAEGEDAAQAPSPVPAPQSERAPGRAFERTPPANDPRIRRFAAPVPPTPRVAPGANAELRGLLEELRGLRQELADLRRELETLREKQLR